MLLPIEIPETERTPLVNWLLNLVAEQKQVIENQEKTIADLESKVERLEEQVKEIDEELKAIKKLKSKPKIKASTLNQEKKTPPEGEKRAGSEKRSKKTSFVPDEERLIEPEDLPEGASFNGYREYDVQDLIIQRHNIRFLLAEYVTPEGKTIVGKLPPEYQGHYGPTLISFTLYQHHQCRVPQTLILEELRELGVDISAGQVNRILIENKESFHQEAASHLAKLQFSSQVLSQGDEQWSQYLESLGITSATAVKLVTEAALLGSAIEGGVSPQLIVRA
jgi:DNA-binding transcriptional MerR regulator